MAEIANLPPVPAPSGDFEFEGLPGNWAIRDGCLVVKRMARTGDAPFDVAPVDTVLPIDGLVTAFGLRGAAVTDFQLIVVSGDEACFEEPTDEVCFIGGKLHRRWKIFPVNERLVAGRAKGQWRPIPSYETAEEAEAAR